jgi:hypothetical protein
LGFAWYKNGWLGLLPFAANLIYNLWTSVALLSGQRFLLAMDWSIYLYYMIGLFALMGGFLFALEKGRLMILGWYEVNSFQFAPQIDPKKWRQYVLVGVLFFGIGLSLPFSEKAFSKRYQPIDLAQALNKLESSVSLGQSKLDAACFRQIVDGNQFSAVQGRAIYPRYYEAGGGETFTDSFGYKIADEGRLVFEMVGPVNRRFVFPMTEPPDFFPNASDVTLFFDGQGNLWFILVEQGDVQRMYFSESLVSPVCN